MHTTESYTGPIFNSDTHLYETDDAYSRYLPKRCLQDWGYKWQTGADGEYALYVGNRKKEVCAEYYSDDGKVPPPGKLHEWLRAIEEGKENVDMRVPMSPDMAHPEPRLKTMDDFGVDACFLYCGDMIATISYPDQLEPAKAIIRAYNKWMLDEWKFNYQDRIYSAPLLLLDDLNDAVEQAKWMVRNGTRLVLLQMRPINGRADTIRQKPMFRELIESQRCLIPTTGFYEWRTVGKKKVPHFIRLKDSGIMAFAGIWDLWTDGERRLRTACLVTTEANAVVRAIHDRMPVIVPRSHFDEWLDPDTPGRIIDALLKPYPAELMELGEANPLVNSPKNEGAELLHRDNAGTLLE